MWLALDGNKDYLAMEDSVYSQNVCIMVDEDSVLYTLMNKCINVTDRHTLSYEVSQKWFDGNGPVYMKENNEDVYMLVLIIFTSVMIAFFIYYQTNKNLYAELENRMEKLNESKKELKTTFNGVSYYLAELDLNGVVLDINRYFFEAVHKNVTNSNIYDILEMDEEGRASLQEMMERASRGEYTESREITRKQDIFEVDMIINTGVAGSLDAAINIGDIVLSVDALQHDVDATVFGYEPGVIPRMQSSVFQADGHLVELAREICSKVNPEIGVHTGRVVSGDQFVSDPIVKDRLANTFNGSCTEMEGAAIAQAAYLNHIPFLIIRAISDKADGSAQMDYGEFEAKAIEHTVNLMDGLLKVVE